MRSAFSSRLFFDLDFFDMAAVDVASSCGVGERLRSLGADWSLSLASDTSSSPNRKPVMTVLCMFAGCGEVDFEFAAIVRGSLWKRSFDM